MKIIWLSVKRFVIFICLARDRNHNNGLDSFDLKLEGLGPKYRNVIILPVLRRCESWSATELGTRGEAGRKWDVKEIILA
jgi:hypothetical protein